MLSSIKRLHVNRITDIKYNTLDYNSLQKVRHQQTAVTKPTSNKKPGLRCNETKQQLQ